MNITTREEEKALVLFLEGNLLGENDGKLILEIINNSIEKNVPNFIFAVEKLKYLNSTGLSIIISTLTKARKNNGEICLVDVQDQLSSLLKITKLDTVFPICATIEEALEKFNTFNK